MNGYLQECLQISACIGRKMLRLLLRGGGQIFAYVMGVCFSRNGSVFQS